MRLSFHGGKCCGVKTIYGFTNWPFDEVAALGPVEQNNKDKAGAEVSSRDRVMGKAAPQETALERLDRYLDWLKQYRPKGLVEIYLTTEQLKISKMYPTKSPGWDEILKDRGFTADEPFQNSNSGNYITRYALVMK